MTDSSQLHTSGSSSFTALFTPLKVGGLTLRNRIVNSGHGTSLGPGTHNEDLLSYEERRAQGGAAVVITQANAVNAKVGDFYVGHEAKTGKYDELARRIHAHGALSFVQINHPGRQAHIGPNSFNELIYSSSAVPQREYGAKVRVPRALTHHEILQVIDDFGAAAEQIAETAVDGIEIHFAHGNLVQQFLSPELNHRQDQWGGDAEGRNRLALEILREVRRRIGQRLVVGARVNLELSPQEDQQSELTDQILALIESGLLDYVSVSGGNFSSLWGVATNLPDASFPPALWREAARKLKQGQKNQGKQNVPIFLAGRVLTPALANQLINEGYCDVVTMARELVADPDLPRKAHRGKVEDIRPCVGIQSGCWQRVADGNPIHCAFNPVAGREADERDNKAGITKNPLSIAVVGAGPAGLEAARSAALLGHKVTLFDRRPTLGGQLTLIEKVPHRQDLSKIIDWFARELHTSGVNLRLGEEVNLDKLLVLKPDAVVIATGGLETIRPEWQGIFEGPIYTINETLAQEVGGQQQVLVYDEWGGRAALSAAEFLLAQGHNVTFVTSLTYAGEGLNNTVRVPALSRLARGGVEFIADHQLMVESGQLRLFNSYSKKFTDFPLSTLLVTSLIPSGNNALYDALLEAGIHTQIIGDARTPRGITEATREGYLAARTFGQAAFTHPWSLT
ncbi:FAD-dependent oxidoreductase [Rouxiella sp. T17]|uniref:oxidoreductase n=1 Tax=Rouxiella sp. T17 TaxID=3085684 RepID=UPI002FC9F4DF